MKKKKYLIIFIIVIIIFTISILFGNNLIKKFNQHKTTQTINQNVMTNNENEKILKIEKENEITKYLPQNITEIHLINHWSTLPDKPTTKIQELDKLKEFTDLLYTTTWTEVNIDDYPYTIIDGNINTTLEYEISFIGDTICNFQMIQRGSRFKNNNANSIIDYGLVSINYENTVHTYEINEKTYKNLITYTSEKYYLHESKLSIPNQEKCNLAQKQAFTSLNDTDKEYLKKKIRVLHGGIEHSLLGSVLVLKEPSSIYWQICTTEGISETYEDRIHNNKNVVKRDNGFTYYLEELPNVISKIQDKETKNDLINCYNILQEGINTHNISKLFEAHEILHDYDYFVFNTPLYLEYEPADWSGVDTYFGKASVLK